MSTSSDQQLFQDVVSRVANCDPAGTALVQHDRTLDYGSLNRSANQVAHYLQSLGAGPESKIGISIGRSIDFVIAALGILKCGSAFVPVDPTYPELRQRFIAEDAGLRAVLYSGRGFGDAPDWPITTTHLESPEILVQPTSDLLLKTPDPQQLAYVIYTSGSTGVAKGVEVTRGNLRHLVDWHNGYFRVTSADRATLLINVGFDASVQELWPYLCMCATLFIPEPEIVREPEMLRDWLLRKKITIIAAPSLLAEALMALPWPQDASLRCMLSGGDKLRISPAPGSPFRLVNVYGPAECTVVATAGEVPPSGSTHRIPSIGRAITGVRIFLLNEDLQEVPPGSQGEICIAGAGVSRGYLNRPELTAQRFIVRGDDGTRIYRSGDLGRLNDDGTIQFLGRMDEQVKIRGYRIECGEIEAALNTLPGVQTSAVVLLELPEGHNCLTAYIVAQPGVELSRDSLRDGLRSVLPEFMLPERFVRLPCMPINENGKVSRRALPAVTEEMIIRSAERPTTQVETELMAILEKLLKVNQIELNDDFFLLGGHSFIANQVIARVRDHFGVELSLRTVFDHPTPAAMAQQVEERIAARPLTNRAYHRTVPETGANR